jgi:hypothetical protein
MTEVQPKNPEKPKMEFIPFHAINEFMRVDYRMILLRNTLLALPDLSPKTQASINRLTKKHVKVPGFRNSAKAPASVKAVSMVKPFEKQPKLVAAVLAGWAEANPDLRSQIFELLNGFGWKLLPLEADRTRLPGFLTQWPEENDYEEIYEGFTEAYPDSEYGIDDVSLMAVWLSLRLPVEKVSKDEIADLPFDYASTSEEDKS